MPDLLSDRMVFLVGAPRSGTNWLQRMLAAHPDVVALPSETHLFSHGLRYLDDQVQHGLLTSPATGMVYLPRDEWLASMRAFCVLVYGRVVDAINPDARCVIERSPHHVFHLELISEVFPDAAFVHLIRDGRDVVRSLARQEWGPGGIREAAEQWRDAITSARATSAGLERYVEVRYEDLMEDPRTRVADLFAQLRLRSDDAVMADVTATAAVPFNVDSNSPTTGIGKWRTEWTDADLDAYQSVAGELGRELGYPDQALLRRPRRSRVRAAARRAVRRNRVSAAPAQAVGGIVTAPEALQITVDRFLAAAADGRLVEAAPDEFGVHYAAADERWAAVGAAGRRRLADAFLSEGSWGRQVYGEEQIHGRTVIVTTTHVNDGETVDRVIVLGFTPGGQLGQVGYNRFPRVTSERGRP